MVETGTTTAAEPTVRLRMSAASRQRQIVDVATGLFSEHGFERVTMSMIAQQCGITDPAIYRHFDSKDSLYEAVLTELKNRIDIAATLEELRVPTELEPFLMGVASFVVKRFSKNTELSRLLLLSSLEGHPLAKRTFEDLRIPFVDLVTEKLREMQKAGLVRAVQPEITARCFIGMVMDCSLGTHLWRDMYGKNYDPDTIIANNIPIYVAGLKADR